MRVLICSQEFPPHTHWGGIATYFGLLAPAMVAAGAEVHVLSVAPGLEPASERRADGVVVHQAPLRRPRGVGRATRLPQTWDRLSLPRAVAAEARRLDVRPDVVVCPSWKAEGLAFAARHRHPLAVHVFSSAEDILPRRGRFSLDRRWAVALEAKLVAGADAVLSPPAQLEKLRRRNAADDGAFVEIACPVVPTASGPPGDPWQVCFVGRFEPRKAPEVLVRAMPELLAAVPEARLLLVGRDSTDADRPSYRRWLESEARALGVEAAVAIVDRWGGQDDALRAMASSAVVAVPSRWESFGYVAAEASGLGRPVVASNLPSFRQVVVPGRTGVLVEGESPSAWAEALASVLADRDRAERLGRAGAAHVAAMFEPGRVAAATLDAYDLARRRHQLRVERRAVGSAA